MLQRLTFNNQNLQGLIQQTAQYFQHFEQFINENLGGLKFKLFIFHYKIMLLLKLTKRTDLQQQAMRKETDFLITTLSRKGSMHKDNNEDFILSLGRENIILNAVFDGCSTGKDSHFASALFAKTLRKVFNNTNLKKRQKLDSLLYNLVYTFINQLNTIKYSLEISRKELLSTVIISLTNTKNLNSEIIVIGDGFISVNGKDIEIDQNNTPNYLAYHLEYLEKSANFDQWYKTETRRFHIANTQKLTIATDGILSFNKEKNKSQNKTIEPIPYLIEDNFLLGNKSMLSRKLNILKNKHSQVNSDDISIIRMEALDSD